MPYSTDFIERLIKEGKTFGCIVDCGDGYIIERWDAISISVNGDLINGRCTYRSIKVNREMNAVLDDIIFTPFKFIEDKEYYDQIYEIED